MAWVAAIVAAIAAAAQYANTQSVARKQDRSLAQGIRERSARQREIDARTNKLVDDIGKSNPEQDKQEKLTKYMDVLLANKSNSTSGIGNVPGASETYANSATKAGGDIADYGSMVAGIMSRIDAPQAQRTREGVMAGDYGVDIDQIKRASSGEDFLNSLRMGKIRRNPWLDAFSTVASSYAGSGGGMGGGASGGGGGGTDSGGVGFGGNTRSGTGGY